MEEIRKKFDELKEKFEKITQQIKREKLKSEIRELELQINKPSFWENQEEARRISQKLSQKQKLLETLENLEKRFKDIFDLLNDPTFLLEIQKEAFEIEESLKELELQLFLSGPHDFSEAILSIHAGTGGIEAMDWAGMLSRMYQRFFERKGWKYEISDESFGEEAGYKSLSMIVHAPFAYGWLKDEAGTHRLVRLSPFNADHLRQTSFAQVEVLPVIEESGEIEINPSEVEFEAFRASGHGGQNVNKVSTAVRLKHLPTGITVTAQTQRSQLQNRENALKILKAKLWILQKLEDKKLKEEFKREIKQASWGNQIRSYILHPYHLVKDLRTGVETSETEKVLNGEIEQFLEKEIKGLDKTDNIQLK